VHLQVGKGLDRSPGLHGGVEKARSYQKGKGGSSREPRRKVLIIEGLPFLRNLRGGDGRGEVKEKRERFMIYHE